MTGLVNPFAFANNFGAGSDPHIGVPWRGYFATAGTSAVSPTPNAGWDVTTSFAARPLLAASELTTGSNASTSSVSETTAAVMNRMMRQHITNVQCPSARMVPAGTLLRVIWGINESSASADDMLQAIVYITDASGTNVGTLYAGQTGTTVSATVGANDEEIASTLLTRCLSVTTPSDVTVPLNARLCVELGYRAVNTVATTFSCTGRMNDQSTGTDLAFTSGTAVSSGNQRPWVELNYDLFGA